MGFFRRYKLTDYTVEECRQATTAIIRQILDVAQFDSQDTRTNDIEKLIEEWACFRELLARHEKKNELPLDEKRQGSN